jgi:hypothetical protein
VVEPGPLRAATVSGYVRPDIPADCMPVALEAARDLLAVYEQALDTIVEHAEYPWIVRVAQDALGPDWEGIK